MEDLLIAMKPTIVRDALVKELSRYNIHICDTGRDALALLDTLYPSIFLLDLALPDMDGLTLLHKSHYKPRVILALTNFVSDTVMQAAAAAGIQDILLIPCTIRYIIKRLDALIEKVPSLEA